MNWRIPKADPTTNYWHNKEKLLNSTTNLTPKIDTSIKKSTKIEIKSSSIEKIQYKSTKTDINNKYTNKIVENSNNAIQINSLTSEELKILNEEPLNTTNPLKAILGYTPKDEQRICKFAKNGECFKSKCHLSHETKIPEGWTKDKSSVIISNCNEPTHPDIGTTFEFIPTYIEECGHKFYGQIISPDLKTFYNLMNEMNEENEINSFENYPSDLIPTLAELVLAKYTDGLFYRGQIIDYDENCNSVLVFFVDYGNMEIVNLCNIKKWIRKFEIIPFQAIHFTLNNVKSKTDKQIEFRYFMEQLLLNKIYNGISIDYFDSTYIKIVNDYETDITDQLLELNLCEKINTFKISFNKCARIPG